MSSLVITNRTRRLVVVAAVVALIATVVLVRVTASDTVAVVESNLPSESFALFDGGETTLADFGGKPLVVNFWASWCPACVAELPELQAIHERFGDQITVLGIANADDRDSAIALAESAGLTYTLADDPKGELFRLLELIAMPSTIFITADGVIHEVFGGQLTENALVERIDKVIAAS